MPVALARSRVATAWACEPRAARSGFRTGRSTCVDEADCAGRSARAKVKTRALDEVARTLLVTLRAPGSPARFATRSGEPGSSSRRPRPFLDATSRKAAPSRGSRCLLPQRNPYVSGGLLLRARLDLAPVTRPPWEVLLRGYDRLCYPQEAPPSDEGSASSGLDSNDQGEPKLRWLHESQRPSRHLRSIQLAG